MPETASCRRAPASCRQPVGTANWERVGSERKAAAGRTIHHGTSPYPNNVIETTTANSYMPQVHVLVKATMLYHNKSVQEASMQAGKTSPALDSGGQIMRP